MKSFAYYVDGALSKLTCFFIGAFIGGYYVKGLAALFAFALVFSLCVSELYLHFLYGKSDKKDSAAVSAVKASFCYCSDEAALEYFRSAIEKKRTVKREDGFLGVGDVAFFSRIKPSSPAPDYVVDAAAHASSLGYKRVVIAAFSASKEAAAVAAEIPYVSVRILDGNETCRLLSSLHALPSPPSARKRKPLNAFFGAAVAKKRAKSYFLAAVLLFVFSRFVRVSVYYIVAAVALVVIGAVVLVVPRGEKKPR